MSECVICHHDYREEIDAALLSGMLPSRVAFRYHVKKDLVLLHQAHLQGPARLEASEPQQNPLVQPFGSPSQAVSGARSVMARDKSSETASCERPLVRFQRAWRDADERERDRMMLWLNEQLQGADAPW